MTETGTTYESDFAGFIAGFEARNLAAIQRNATSQVSEMRTRLVILSQQIELTESELLKARFAAAHNAFTAPEQNVLNRLVAFGEKLIDLLLECSELLRAKPSLWKMTTGLISCYLDAATATRNDEILRVACRLAEVAEEQRESGTA